MLGLGEKRKEEKEEERFKIRQDRAILAGDFAKDPILRENLRKIVEFRRFGVGERRKEKVGRIWVPGPRVPQIWGNLLRIAEQSRTVLPQNLFRDQIFKCISASRTCFQTVIS
uniref:Uncharacterized protein n=1 Tax=Solanum tuberosum TaxID=4113 RepID=M1E090_SOLTU